MLLLVACASCSVLEDIRFELPDLPGEAPPPDRPDKRRPDVGDLRFSFSKPGTFHQPTRAKPSIRFPLDVARGARFQSITVDLDVTHGGWFGREPERNHSIFWLHRARRWRGNVVAYVNAFGPGRNGVRLMTNLNRSSNEASEKRGVRLQPGRTYHVRYVFDGANRTMSVRVTGNGVNALTQQRVPYSFIESPTDGSGFFLYFGHEDHTGRGPERPSYGWKYSHLRLEMRR